MALCVRGFYIDVWKWQTNLIILSHVSELWKVKNFGLKGLSEHA